MINRRGLLVGAVSVGVVGAVAVPTIVRKDAVIAASRSETFDFTAEQMTVFDRFEPLLNSLRSLTSFALRDTAHDLHVYMEVDSEDGWITFKFRSLGRYPLPGTDAKPRQYSFAFMTKYTERSDDHVLSTVPIWAIEKIGEFKRDLRQLGLSA